MSFTHVDAGGAVMVDVSEKTVTHRKAIAAGSIRVTRECFTAIKDGEVKKGAVLNTARVAGIMAAKRTPELIPLCHTLNLTNINIEFTFNPGTPEIKAFCTVHCEGQTGVEMEALTGVTASLLTIYDMCKAIDKNMQITGIRLIEKTGGKSGPFRYDEDKKENKP